MKTFREALRDKDFVVTSELFLHTETDKKAIELQAELLRGLVDGVLVTDNQSGRLHMSSLAAAIILREFGVDPILQLSCRNRNRISILGDLLGAGAHGIGSLQLIRGERVPDEFTPRPKAVLDLSATELIATAHKMAGANGIGTGADFLLGGVISVREPGPGWVPRKLLQKVDAGAQFLVSHICMDVDLIRRYVEHLVALKVMHRTSIIVAIAVLASAEEARWIRDNRPNVMIPKTIVKKLAQAGDPRAAGISICAEQMRDLATLPGVSGVHICAASDLRNVTAAIASSGIEPPGKPRMAP